VPLTKTYDQGHFGIKPKLKTPKEKSLCVIQIQMSFTRAKPRRVATLCYQTFFITPFDPPRAKEIIIKNSSSVN